MFTIDNLTSKGYFSKLAHKTQMVKSIYVDPIFGEYTNRNGHTIDVMKTCKEIVATHSLEKCVDENRLVLSAYAHDIGHTPFGHAGENRINEFFQSNDNIHFSESYPGVFRHNVNSIRLLYENNLLTKDEKEMVLIDSILKHTRVFPKNYAYVVFKESNVIKMNYVFSKSGLEKSEFLKGFISKTSDLMCPSTSKNVLKGRKETKGCKKGTLCFIGTKEYPISSYLMYPHPLTIEGTVLLWADEISCFCSDLTDFFRILCNKRKNPNLDKIICLTRIYSNINWVSSFFSSNPILALISDCLEIIKKPDDKSIDVILEKIKKIKKELILSLEVDDELKQRKKDEIIVKDDCSLIFNLNESTRFLFQKIKSSIYADLHSFEEVDNWNTFGELCLNELIAFYLNNLRSFFKDAAKYSVSNIFSFVWNGVYSMLGIEHDMLFPIFLSKANAINSSYDSFSIDDMLKHEFMREAIGFALKRNVWKEGYVKNSISNLFKREICFFISKLSDKEIIELIKEKNLLKNIREKNAKVVDFANPLL